MVTQNDNSARGVENGLPTQTELTEFWEWCGWTFHKAGLRQTDSGWEEWPDHWQPTKGVAQSHLPDLDLNALFRYAVPKVRGIELKLVNLEKTGNLSGQYCSAQVQRKDTGELIHSGYQTDPRIAIFRAIQRVARGSPAHPPPSEAIKP